jgi:hypothetical protein
MGLLDFEGPDDPKRAFLLQLAGGLLANRGTLAQGMGQGLMSAVPAYYQARGANDKRLEEAQQREARQLEIQHTRGLLDRENQWNSTAAKYFGSPTANFPQGDDEGNPMPQIPPSMDWSGFMHEAPRIDPTRALGLQAQLAQINQREGPLKVNRNERLVDPRTGRVTLDAAPDLPPGMRMGANGQPEYMPAYVQGQTQIRAAGRPQTNVNLPPAQKAFEVELAKLDAKQLDDFRDSAVKAQNGLSRIGEMKRLAQEGMYSGWGASGRAGAANFFQTLGLPFDPTKLENSQQYNKHAKELTLSMLKEGVGTQNISNADLAFVNETVPQLETNPKARLALLDYMERRLGQSVERFQNADSYARERGGLSGFNYQPGPKREQPTGPLSKNQTALFQARQAIKQGKSRDAVIQRLREQGFDPAGL